MEILPNTFPKRCHINLRPNYFLHLLVAHTAGWLSIIYTPRPPHPPAELARCVFIVQQSKLDIVYDAWYWKQTPERAATVLSTDWTSLTTDPREFCWCSETRVSPSTTKGRSFYIYGTTEVWEILMTLGRNYACQKKNSATARVFFLPNAALSSVREKKRRHVRPYLNPENLSPPVADAQKRSQVMEVAKLKWENLFWFLFFPMELHSQRGSVPESNVEISQTELSFPLLCHRQLNCLGMAQLISITFTLLTGLENSNPKITSSQPGLVSNRWKHWFLP